MILLNPRNMVRDYPDRRSREIMEKTIAFFERKGLTRLKEDYHGASRYGVFIEFCKREGILASLMTPARHGKEGENAVWDAWRVCGFAEIPGFYGLCYRYVYQVSVLGIGPIWMSGNQDAQARAKRLLDDGNIFAFGLSEREHGAGIYASDMIVTGWRTAATPRRAASTTSAMPTRRQWFRSSARWPMATDTSSSSPIRSTRTTG